MLWIIGWLISYVVLYADGVHGIGLDHCVFSKVVAWSPTVSYTLCLSGQFNSFEFNKKQTFVMEFIGLPPSYEAASTSVHLRIINENTINSVETRLKRPDKHSWVCSYYLFDDATVGYKLQIRVSWLRGSVLDTILPLKNMDGLRFLEYSDYLDEIIYDAPLILSSASSVARESFAASPQLPLCTMGNREGRWVRTAFPGEYPYINDKLGFNKDRIWQAHSCRYRIMSRRDVLRCFAEKNITKIAFTGDSLMREHFQNLVMLLQPGVTKEYNMVKFRDDKYLALKFENQQTLNLYYYLFSATLKELQSVQPDVHFWSFSLLKNLVSEREEKLLPELIEKFFLVPYNNLVKSHQSAKQLSRNRFYLHPRIQREDPRVNREGLLSSLASNQKVPSVNSFGCLTSGRQQLAIDKTWKLLGKYKLLDSVIDGYTVSSSRWESSWDGIHYSLLLGGDRIVDSDSNVTAQDVVEACPAEYVRGGRHLCGHVSEIASVNKCVPQYHANYWHSNASKSTHSSKTEWPRMSSVKERDTYMYWCTNMGSKFHHFEGGVSNMLTMIWLNSICNSA